MGFFSLKITRYWVFVTGVVLMGMFCVKSSYSYSYQIRPVSHHLWIKLDKKDQKILDQISAHIDAKEYDKAMKLADSFQEFNQTSKEEGGKSPKDKGSNPFFLNKTDFRVALKNIIFWSKYTQLDVEKKNVKYSFSDLSRFVVDNGFYPNIQDLRDKVEVVVRETGTPYRVSSQYFKSNPAKGTKSKMYLIESKEEYLKQSKSENEKDEIVDELKSDISLTWIESDYNDDEMREYLDKYSGMLTNDDHVKRIERLIWDKSYSGAKKILNLVDGDHAKYYENVIQILQYPSRLDKYVDAIPRRFRSSELTQYAKTRWYFKKDQTKKAVKMLKRVNKMDHPEKWWGLRLVYVRELLKTDDGDDAYEIASKHSLTEDSKKYWEAQWTSGWVALRFDDEPEIAYTHFKKLYDHVKQPVSIARATYWLGMAAQASGNQDLALKWYKEASEYPLYFYGQLAIHKRRALDPLNSDEEIILPKDPEVRIADAHEVSDDLQVKVAYLLAMMGDKKNASEIFKNYIYSHGSSPGKIALIMRIASEFDDHEMDSIVSRAAEHKNVFFIRSKFRLVKEVEDGEYSALIHALIKQESAFVPTATSRVGAKGYMQLMPDTAKNVAKDLDIRYNRRKLTDPEYNIRLGSHYIKKMVERFDGSKMLAIAAYNAGPHNSDRWIREFYDPRKEQDIDKVVDWIELITYYETRNYVQRIMENMITYKYIMGTKNKD